MVGVRAHFLQGREVEETTKKTLSEVSVQQKTNDCC